MDLAMMLASDAEHDRDLVEGLAAAALRRGDRVSVFLLDGAAALTDWASRLAGEGARVVLCEADAAMRGIHKAAQPRVLFGSLHDWTRMVADADRVISLA